jgi:hypothetical protein
MANPKVPNVRGKYPICYGDIINQKKRIRTTRSQNHSRKSLIKHFTKNNSSEDEDYEEEEYGEDEYFVEKVISHKKKPDVNIL